jgi:hypothetical protein
MFVVLPVRRETKSHRWRIWSTLFEMNLKYDNWSLRHISDTYVTRCSAVTNIIATWIMKAVEPTTLQDRWLLQKATSYALTALVCWIEDSVFLFNRSRVSASRPVTMTEFPYRLLHVNYHKIHIIYKSNFYNLAKAPVRPLKTWTVN